MRKFLIILVMGMAGTTCIAEVVRNGITPRSAPRFLECIGNTFETASQTDVQTPYTWKDKDGKTYPIYITKKGACYVKRISKKTGKEYKYYLPKETQEQIRKELGM